MRGHWGIIAVLLGLSVLLFLPPTVSAETIVVSERITITASVKPARYVVVNASDQIDKIISNNSLADIEPEFYRSEVGPNNRLTATYELRQETDQLLDGVEIKPGVLYDRKKVATGTQTIDLKKTALAASPLKLFSLKS